MRIDLSVTLRDGTSFEVSNVEDLVFGGGNTRYWASEFRQEADRLVADIESRLTRLYGDTREDAHEV